MSIPQSGGGPIESQAQLAEYLEAGCKAKDDWRIGTEHEKFGYLTDTHEPLPYDGPRSIRAVLEGLRDRYGWARCPSPVGRRVRARLPSIGRTGLRGTRHLLCHGSLSMHYWFRGLRLF